MRSLLLIGGVVGLAVPAVPVWGQSGAKSGLSAKSAGELVSDLSSDKYKEREAAQKELLRRGAESAKPLKDALRNGSLGEEAADRARAILAKVDVPDCGAVCIVGRTPIGANRRIRRIPRLGRSSPEKFSVRRRPERHNSAEHALSPGTNPRRGWVSRHSRPSRRTGSARGRPTWRER